MKPASSAFFLTLANVVPGQPFWIPDPTQPAGRALNPAAFSLPPPGVQGNYPRNSLRSPYSIDQTDLALRRRFNLTERVKLDIRAEYFNVFNHPMFGAPGFNEPNTEFGVSGFGKVGTTTNEALGGWRRRRWSERIIRIRRSALRTVHGQTAILRGFSGP